MQHRVDALDVPLEVAVRRVHVLPSSLSSCDACTRFAARVHERFASSGPRAPLNRVNALHSALKGVPLARFGACPPAPSQLPRVVLLGARGARAGTPPAAAGADGVGDIPDELARALAAAVPVPPGDFHVIGGLTQPEQENDSHRDSGRFRRSWHPGGARRPSCGNVKSVERVAQSTDRYTEADILAAFNAIETEFASEFEGCAQ